MLLRFLEKELNLQQRMPHWRMSLTAILLRQNGGKDLTGTTSASCNGWTWHGPHSVTCVIFIITAGLATSSITAPFSPFQGPLTAQPTAPICMAAAQRALAVHHCSIYNKRLTIYKTMIGAYNKFYKQVLKNWTLERFLIDFIVRVGNISFIIRDRFLKHIEINNATLENCKLLPKNNIPKP